MMGDSHSSFTTTTDEHLYNQFSPGRRYQLSKDSYNENNYRKNDFPAASSSSSSPNLRRSPNRTVSSPRVQQKPITIFDQIVDWFQAEISVRKRLAGAACGYLSTIFFIVTVSILKLTIWAPFSSVQG